MPLKIDYPHPITLDYRIGEEIFNGLPDSLVVETKYLMLQVMPEESANGQTETWTKIITRPAFEIAFLIMLNGELHLMLMQKRRKANDSLLTKLPGGYFSDDLNYDRLMEEKVLHDTGIRFSSTDLVQLNSVIGHSEIHTPISLFYTTAWEVTGAPKDGITIEAVPFRHAVALAINGGIENDSSFSAIMQLFVLQQWKRLKI
ncbi:MAG: hypothetical protein WCT08_05750 [Patescibacteria group bacterium]|jgi:hypothetical protein